MQLLRDLDFSGTHDIGWPVVAEVGVEGSKQPRDYNLMVGRRRRRHEQDSLDQLVALPVVGERAHHIHGVRRKWERHGHNVPPRRGSKQSAMRHDRAR